MEMMYTRIRELGNEKEGKRITQSDINEFFAKKLNLSESSGSGQQPFSTEQLRGMQLQEAFVTAADGKRTASGTGRLNSSRTT